MREFDAALDELDADDSSELPASTSTYSRDDIFVLGYFDRDRLIAEMSLLRGYPAAGDWWVALFVVDPAYRGRGTGRRICEATFEWIGSGTIVMAVDEKNPRGEKFWRSLGFAETKRVDYTAPTTGSQRRLIIMRRGI